MNGSPEIDWGGCTFDFSQIYYSLKVAKFYFFRTRLVLHQISQIYLKPILAHHRTSPSRQNINKTKLFCLLMSMYRGEITERSTSRVQEHEMIHTN